jgi:hypothetical protein
MKKAFDWLMAAERNSKIEDVSVETFKTEMQREKRENEKEYPRIVGNYKRYAICIMGILKEESNRRNI